MEIIPGRKMGTHIYIYDDYLYCMDSRYDNVFRCNSRKSTKCPGNVVLQDNNIKVLKEHNHPKLPFIKLRNEMKEEMLKLVRETHMGLKEIFDTVCRR